MKKLFSTMIFLTSVLLFVIAFEITASCEVAYTYNIPDKKPIDEHPRIYITSNDISTLRAKETDPITATSWNKLRELANTSVSGVLEPVDEAESNYNSGILDAIKAKALMYVMYPDENTVYGEQAVNAMTAYLQTVSFCNPSFEGETRQIGYVMESAAVVYDWCYNLVNDKAYYIQRFKELSALKEVGWPPEKGNSISSHAGEEEIFRDLLTAGIACYDEDPEIYNRAAGRYFDIMAPAREFYCQSRGVHPQGTSYGLMRGQWEALSVNIFDAMGHKDVMGKNISQLPYWNIYARRPDGQWLTDGDDYMMSQAKHFEYKTLDYMLLLLNGNLYEDPYLCSLWLKEYAMSNYSKSNFYSFIFYNPGITTASIQNLPLARYFGFPHSRITARTTWQNGLNSPGAIADFNMKNIYNDNGTHLDVGSFQIYYKGALALDSGNYEGKDSRWGKVPHFNYYMRSVSHNVMLVHNENEEIPKFWWTNVINDGGQRIPDMTLTLAQLKGEGNILSEEESHDIGPDENNPDYAYIKSDLTKAYTEKVSAYDRSFVYLNLFDEDYPMAVIVYDNITSSDKSFKKSWLLHSIEEPEINENITTVRRTEDGYNGKLVNSTLLPESDNTNIEKIGGEGYEAWVNGVNYHNRPFDEYTGAEPGNWRIEISPKADAENDVFINAMYVTDADNEESLDVQKRDFGNYWGVEIKDRVVLLSKNSKLCSDEINISTENCQYDNIYYLITDVSPGMWEIEGEGKEIYAEAAEGENTIYFYAPSGDYTVKPAENENAQLQNFAVREKEFIGDFDIFNHSTGLYLYLKEPTRLIENNAYIPVSVLSEMGAEAGVLTDGKISIKHGNNSIALNIGKKSAQTDFGVRAMNNAPVLINDVLYIPIEDVAPMLGIYAKYDSVSNNLFIRYDGIISSNCDGEFVPMDTVAKINIDLSSAPDYENLQLYITDEDGVCEVSNLENGCEQFDFCIALPVDYKIYAGLTDSRGVICKSNEITIRGYDYSTASETLVSEGFEKNIPTSIYAYNGEAVKREAVDEIHGKSIKFENNESSTVENSLFVYKSVKSGMARCSAEVYFKDFSERRYIGIYSASKKSFLVYIDKSGNVTYDGRTIKKIETDKWYKFEFILDLTDKKCTFLLNNTPLVFSDANLEGFSRLAIFNSPAGGIGTIYTDNIEISKSRAFEIPAIKRISACIGDDEYLLYEYGAVKFVLESTVPEGGGGVTLDVSLANKRYEGDSVLIAALYENGTLISCDVEKLTLTPYESQNITLSPGSITQKNDASLKVMIWDKGIKPFYSAVSIE